MSESKIYNLARATWGDAHQMGKSKEECLEYVLACFQYEQGRVTVQAVIDELADVLITAQQARLILGPEAVDAAKKRKLDRLSESISVARSRRGVPDVPKSKQNA